MKCLTGGSLACGITHIGIVPFDIAKCKKQIDHHYSSSIIEGIKKVKTAKQLTLGWSPTLIGYSFQGAGKFGFY